MKPAQQPATGTFVEKICRHSVRYVDLPGKRRRSARERQAKEICGRSS